MTKRLAKSFVLGLIVSMTTSFSVPVFAEASISEVPFEQENAYLQEAGGYDSTEIIDDAVSEKETADNMFLEDVEEQDDETLSETEEVNDDKTEGMQQQLESEEIEQKTEDIDGLTVKSIASAEITLEYDSCVYNGSARLPEVAVVLDDLTLVKDADYTVSYENNINAGIASAILSGIGEYEGSVTKTFTIKPASVKKADVELAKTSYVYANKKRQPGVKSVTLDSLSLKKNADYSVTYKSNINAGTAKVVITGKGNFTGTVTKKFTITKASLKSASLKYAALVYTGKNRTQTKATVVKANVDGKSTVLRRNKDYKVTYKNNKNIGTATVTITGKGKFTGTITKTFKILPKTSPADDGVNRIAFFGDSITLGRDGSTAHPAKIVSIPYPAYIEGYYDAICDNFGVGSIGWLHKGSGMTEYEYLVKQDISSYDAIVFALGCNDASLKSQYGTVSDTAADETVAGNFVKCVQYVRNANPYAKIVIVAPWHTKNSKKEALTNLLEDLSTKHELAFIKQDTNPLSKDELPDGVHPVQSGYETDGEWLAGELASLGLLQSKKAIELKDAVLKYDSLVFTGKGRTQTKNLVVTAKSGPKPTLTYKQDYTVSYKNNTNVGTATIIIKGIGKYTGEIIKTFKITPRAISRQSTIYPDKTEFVYTGKAIKPGVTVTTRIGDREYTLKEKTDYTVSYDGNIKAGKATVAVKGINNYKGTLSTAFLIKQPVAVKSIAFKESDVKIAQGKNRELKLNITPASASKNPITWKSSDKSVVTVSSNGKITAKKPGKVTVTATCNGKSAKCSVKVNIKGVITFIDDDGHKYYKDKILPIVQETGVNYSCAVTPWRIENKPARFMSWEEIKECSDAGAEILCHTLKHVPSDQTKLMTEEEIKKQYIEARKILEEHGYSGNILIYNGATGKIKKCRTAAAAVYDCGISASGKVIASFDDDPYFYKRFSLLPYLHDKTDVIKGWIDQVEEEGGWMICITHSYEPTLDEEALGNLRSVIHYAQDNGVEIVTAQEGYKRTSTALG